MASLKPRNSTIRASEIGTYLFCQRAWWHGRQGVTSENVADMVHGTLMHEQHGKTIMIAGFYRGLAYLFFLTALILGAVYLTDKIL